MLWFAGPMGPSDRNTARASDVLISTPAGGACTGNGASLPQWGHALRSVTNDLVGEKSSAVRNTRLRRQAGQGIRMLPRAG